MTKTFEVTLPSGETLKGRRYEKKDASQVLCLITGMCEHSLRYDDFAKFLNKNGIEVYVLDAFGQGLNAESEADLQIWPEDGFEKNVNGLEAMIQLASKSGLPITLMGHSMGSFMVQRYLERFPGHVKKAILCGSNGGQLGLMKLANFVGKLLINKKNWKKPIKLITNLAFGPYVKGAASAKTEFDWLSYNEANVQAYIADPYCGAPNTGSFWKGFFAGMVKIWDKKEMAKLVPTEVLIISGKEDPVGQFGSGLLWLRDAYKARGLKVVLHLYSNMRHEVLNEDNKQEVYDDVLRFLVEGK